MESRDFADEVKPLDDALNTVVDQLAKIKDENPGISWAEAARIRRERFGTVEK